MSISSEIKRIVDAKNALSAAINAKGGNLTGTQLLDDYAAAVTALPTGESADLSFITASAEDILSGKVGADADGNPVSGTIQTVTATLTDNKVTVPKGHIANEQTLTVAEMAEPSVSANVVTIPVGYNKTQKTKTIPEAGELTVSENIVTVPVGYVKSERTVEIPAVSATLSGNKVTIPAGYNGGQTLTVAEAKAPEVDGNVITIYPGYVAQEQTVEVEIPASGTSMDFYKCAAVHGPEEVVCYEVTGCPDSEYNGRYLPTEFETSGYEQTYIVYKHETNNVYYFYSDGYGEFGLGSDYEDGSFTYRGSVDSSWYDSDWMTVEGMSMTESTTLINTDVPKTWDGYKAVQSSGVYTFESEVTTGLKWSDIRPEIPHVYSADVKIKADWLDDGDKFSKGLIFHAPLTDRLDYAETGQMLENHGVQLTTLDGVKCARFDGSSYISIPKKFAARLSTGASTPLTIIVNFRGDTNSSGNVLQTRASSAADQIYPVPSNSTWSFGLRGGIGDSTKTSFYEPNRWWTVVMTTPITKKQSGVVIGKTVYATSSISSRDSLYNAMYIGTSDGSTSGAFAGYINEVRIYDRAFTYDEAFEYVEKFGFPDKLLFYDERKQILHFDMNDSGTAAVDKINNISLAASGTPTPGAAGVNGSTCWEVTTNPSYLRGENKVLGIPQYFTFNMVVNLTENNNSSQHCLIDFGGNDYRSGFGIHCQYGKLGFRIAQTKSAFTTPITFNTWHVVTCTWNCGIMTLYLDGVKSTEFSYNGLIVYDPKITMFMRGDKDNEGQAYGKIDEVSMWNYVMTDAEIAELVREFSLEGIKYQAFYAPLSESTTAAETGQALTVSGNVTYGTVDGVPCATFDGNSDITFPDAGMPTGTAARTLSCWCKINSIETNSNPALFGYGARENGKFCGLFIESDLKVVFSGYNEQNHLYSPAGAVSVGKWYHVAAVKNGVSEKLYINGVKVAEGTTGKNTELALGTIAYTTDTTVHKFNGSLAACRIYDGALSDSEIAELAGEFNT